MAEDKGMVALVRTINELGEAFGLFRETNDKRVAEIKAQVDRLERGGADVSGLRERLEDLEARAGSPSAIRPKRDSEHVRLFGNWLRKPTDVVAQTELSTYESHHRINIRGDVTIGTGAPGGFAVPEEISREIGRLELQFSPVRALVKVQPVSTGDYKELVSRRGTTSAWVGETGTRSATVTPQLRERVPTWGELYAYPKASQWALDDMFFDAAQWLAEEVAQEFAQEEGIAVISGSGTNRPTGMLNTAPVTTADFASPERSANAYQYVNSDMTPGGAGILADALIDLVFSLNSAYRSRATWVFNSTTAAGQPDRLLGYPVAIWENVPAIAAGAFCVGFGDWRRAYVLAERVPLRIVRDPVTEPGFTKFWVHRRVGGCVLDNHASRWLRTE
jgi:HK97 family phage major capsid protein